MQGREREKEVQRSERVVKTKEEQEENSKTRRETVEPKLFIVGFFEIFSAHWKHTEIKNLEKNQTQSRTRPNEKKL